MYLIDTYILSYAVRGDAAVLDRFEEAGASPLLVSTITLYEIRFGIERSSGRTRLHAAFEAIAPLVTLLPVDEQVAGRAASIRAELESQGMTIGPIDPLIAGTAIVHELTLVTHNTSHFKRIPHLEVEDWKL